MAVDTSVIGKSTGAYKVRVERGPVEFFASAVLDENPVYHDPAAAAAAGFAEIPAPPTFWFAMQHMGSVPRAAATRPDTGRESDARRDGRPLRQGRAHPPRRAGVRVITARSSSATCSPVRERWCDAYEKETDSAVMTFIVIETAWRDDETGDPVLTERFNLIGRIEEVVQDNGGRATHGWARRQGRDDRRSGTGHRTDVRDSLPRQGHEGRGRRSEPTRAAAGMAALEGHGEALLVETDISDADSAEACAKATAEAFGRIDVLINNAAIYHDIDNTICRLGCLLKIMSVNQHGTGSSATRLRPRWWSSAGVTSSTSHRPRPTRTCSRRWTSSRV